MRLSERFTGWLKATWGPSQATPQEAKGPCVHVVMLDGTMSSLTPGEETNVGLMFQLLRSNHDLSLYYEPGIQWRGWRRAHEVASGVGINRQIRRAYTFLAARYQPGDKVFFVGYSRGAYAVRALAGMIDRIGLLRPDALTPERVNQVYRYYRDDPSEPAARAFVARHCHLRPQIEAVCVFDTVRALGNRWPLFWQFAPRVHAFRSNHLSRVVARGYHALALHETRAAFAPELWEVPIQRHGDVEQVWFRGHHGIIGGHLLGDLPARGLSNIPLVWMLERMAWCGLPLPEGWQGLYPLEPGAVFSRRYRGVGRLFLKRRPREVGRCKSERLHESVGEDIPDHARDLA